jgi:ribosomal-protein-alanine N-acetyltransferase
VTEPLEIRRLSYADLPQVIAIERRAFTTPWSLAMFVLELSKPSGICLAGLRGGRIVGYLVCSRYDTVWHVMNVAVDDRLRRQGIASALLEHLFAEADRPGEQYTLEVRPSNPGGIALYEGFGFKIAGKRPGYYHDNREDAVIMWRKSPARRATPSQAAEA